MAPDRMHENAWYPRDGFKVIVMERLQVDDEPDPNKRLWEFFGFLIVVFSAAGFGFLLLWIAGLI